MSQFATIFVLDVLEGEMGWEIDTKEKASLYDVVESFAEGVQRDATEEHDDSHLHCVPEEEVIVRRKKV